MAFDIDSGIDNSTENTNSRYVQGGTTEIYTNRLGWWERRELPRSDDDVRLTVRPKEAGRPDLISYRLYGKAIYAWVVLQYNNIIDVEEELVAGAEIFLPSQQRLILDIVTKPAGGNIKE